METMPTFVYFEDDALSRKVMEVLITRRAGYPDLTIFDESSNPIHKLESLPYKPDIIFMDIHMEPLNGFQVLELLRNNDLFQNTKVIALTASVMNEEVDLLKQTGFDGAIAKPIDQLTFLDTLQRILSGQELWIIV